MLQFALLLEAPNGDLMMVDVLGSGCSAYGEVLGDEAPASPHISDAGEAMR